ncbi:MAG TPA: hypothetical protein VN048_00100 [Verrucomicrobiae bacterium]|jgi:hypothetical protein|nr:hypothetical protein [Verrucomicrobiae bacterium]
MKTACMFVGVLMAACRLHAGLSVDWISDSYDSFDVVLSGTGPGWSGTITSPSGLWQLSSANIIYYPAPGQNSLKVFVDNTGVATYLGSLSAQFVAPNQSAPAPFNTASIGTYGGYQDYFNPAGPINDKNSLVYGYLSGLDWSGMSTISFTLMPNLNDPSNWAWTANYSACGESLEAPEPNTICIGALGALLGMAFGLRKSMKRGELFSNEVKNILFGKQIPVIVRTVASQSRCWVQPESAMQGRPALPSSTICRRRRS